MQVCWDFWNVIKYKLLLFVLPGDQVEHAHDNPLDEITLGEYDMTASMTLDEVSSEKPVTPKRMNLEIDKEPESKGEAEEDPQVEEKKTKKKDAKKEKAKRENMQGRMFYSNMNMLQCGRFNERLLFQRWNRMTRRRRKERRRRRRKKRRRKTKWKNLTSHRRQTRQPNKSGKVTSVLSLSSISKENINI